MRRAKRGDNRRQGRGGQNPTYQSVTGPFGAIGGINARKLTREAAAARRSQQVSKQIQRYVATIIDEEIALPTLVSVTGVSCDLSFKKARVKVSVYGDDALVAEAMDALDANAWLVRRELSHRTKMKRTPEIEFVNDPTNRDGQAMIDLIDSLASGESSSEV